MPRWRSGGVELALAALLLLACGDAERNELSFVRVDEPRSSDEQVVIDAESRAEARVQVLEGAARPGVVPTFVGAGTWETWTVGPDARSVEERVAAGRTYVRQGGALRLDVRLGAGDRGAFMGGLCASGAERAMLEVELEDRETLGARFAIRLHALVGEPRARDVTPHYLMRPVARGEYRAWVDVPPLGARWVVEVRTLDREGAMIGWAFSSPIEVRRPWL